MAYDFIKKIEDFTCLNCGQEVVGTGYTNHCPICLFSRHVDINPGDRAADCGGLMEPNKIELISGQYIITHQCLTCRAQKRNKAAEEDRLGDFLADMLE